MIEVTDEMVQLALDVFLATPTDSIAQIDAGMAEALAAVLAIVERRLPRCPYVEWGFKVRLCSLPFGHEGGHDLEDRVLS